GLAGTASAGEAADHVEQLPLPCLRPEGRRGPLGIRHAEKIEHEWEPLGERLIEQQHASGDLVARRPRCVVLGDPEAAAMELEDREKRYCLSVGKAVALVNRDLPRAAALSELIAKPTLPGPRLGNYPDDLRVPRDRLLERRLQSRHLALASNELSETARAGH